MEEIFGAGGAVYKGKNVQVPTPVEEKERREDEVTKKELAEGDSLLDSVEVVERDVKKSPSDRGGKK